MAKSTTKKKTAKKSKKKATKKKVEAIHHDEASRSNIPTAELKAVMSKEDQSPIQIAYERRNRDLDPQLVWRGKDEQDRSDLVVNAPPIFIQEKVHPKALIDDLMRRTQRDDDHVEAAASLFADQFADFDGLEDSNLKTEFYQHEANWSNRMILGDSLQVMASLAERESLRGKVQCIYMDPPYGIKFNSNFQWSTTSRDVKDGKTDHITREPEMVRAFRDTWRDGIHSYLTYLRDRLTAARELLTESGSIFVQIGDENVHRVRSVMDEVLGDDNYVSLIQFRTASTKPTTGLSNVCDFLLWYARDRTHLKLREVFTPKSDVPDYEKYQTPNGIISVGGARKSGLEIDPKRVFSLFHMPASVPQSMFAFQFQGKQLHPKNGWRASEHSLNRLARADRLQLLGQSLKYIRRLADFPCERINSAWLDMWAEQQKLFVVQTSTSVVQRCMLMTSDPGDLVLDPTCGSGTTATVAEQWGRRWITIDTSRVALTLARSRVMGARYPYYVLADSDAGLNKEAELSCTPAQDRSTHSNIRQGFVYERVPHITLKSIASNVEIDVIWEQFQEKLEPLREQLNSALSESWEEWEIPREADDTWPDNAKKLHADWWKKRIARQSEIDASIGAKADYEYLYDKPYADKAKVRVAGPMTIESLSPHRSLTLDEDDNLIDPADATRKSEEGADFTQVMLEHLKSAGVQQAHKEDKISFVSLKPWPGDYIAAEGRYVESDSDDAPEKRAGVFIGPEYGTVSRQDLVAAAREAAEAGFEVLIACAFNYEALTTEFNKLGAIPVLKARMNADLHMAEDLKNTGKGNLFVIFGEPDIDLLDAEGGKIQVKINGVDVFHPASGEVRSDNADGIACWFIDTDYDEESFCVRHAYFLGAGDPYKALKTTLKAEINQEAWDTLNSDTSRPFKKPDSGRIAVKVINHLGDEVMKVFRVD